MSQDQKNQVKSVLNFILITGMAYGAIISPCIAKTAPQVACEFERERLLGEWKNVASEYAIKSSSLTPEHPVIIDLQEKITKLRILFDKSTHRCPPVWMNYTLIIPGKRIGPITQKTTYQNLIDRFGEDRLMDGDWGGG